MECFIDFIGIKGGNSTGEGPYINDLPGITFNMIDKIVDKNDHDSFEDLWREIQRVSLKKFKKDAITKFTAKYVGFCCDTEDCDLEKIICDNKSLFEDAWMYCLGVALMNERMYSSRMNRFTTIDKGQAFELKDYYLAEYEKSINHAIKYLPKEIIEKCFECRSNIDYVEVLP